MTLGTRLALAAACWLAAAAVSTAPLFAQDPAGGPFPYFAYVIGSDVHLRSGPGMQYYPTERLPQGIEVEVYRHDPGGWLAVRPTASSFSWVLARYVRVAGENQGIIVGDGVVARTGSRLSDVRDVIQVQLNYGEPVTILGVREFGEGRNREAWVQIAPPAGEFRWIAERDVRRAPATVAQAPPRRRESEEAPSRASTPKSRPAAASRDEEASDAIAEVDYERDAANESASAKAAPESESAGDGWKTSSSPPPKKKPRDAVVRADFRESDRAGDDAPRRESSAASKRSFDEAFADDSAPERRLQRDALQDEADRLASLQADVAREAARDSAEWDFDDLHAEAERLAERGEQEYVRRRAREIREQIERFEDIRDRRRGLAAERDAKPAADERPQRVDSGIRRASQEEPADDAEYAVRPARYDDQPVTEPSPQLPKGARAGVRPASSVSTSSASTPTESADDPRFDAVGVLTPIVATRVGDPSYALLDERGEVCAYVAPGPGVSLRRCVGERIGVVGSASVLPQLGGKTLVVVRRAASVAN